MIFPLINYSATYQVDKEPYAIFQFIENQHLVKSVLPFQRNAFNLVAGLLHNDPLIMQFYLDKAFRPYRVASRHAASLLRATFVKNQSGALVHIKIRSNWCPVFFYGLLLIYLVVAVIQGGAIIPYIIEIIVFVLLDISGKTRVKKNFEKLIAAAGNH